MDLQTNIQTYPNLYHIDQDGNLRVWYMERDGHRYRSISGRDNGAKVTSEWREAESKNVGRSNETSPQEQADLEIQSIYRDRLSRKYAIRADEAKMSNFLAPMLAATYDPKKHLKKMSVFISQPKLDGNRFLASEDGGHSRSGKPFMTVDHILEKLREVFETYNITLDGELYNHDLKDEFEKLTSLINTKKIERLTEEDRQEIRDKVQYHVYDVILHDRPSATTEERLDFLDNLFAEFSEDFGEVIQLVPSSYVGAIDGDIKNFHNLQVDLGFEGLMLRDPKAPYEHKRTKALIKVKNFIDREFKILEIREGQGNWAGAAKSVTVEISPGVTSDASMTGSFEKNKKIFEEKEEYTGGDATVKFQGFTEDGKLRFGVVKILYKGKRES